MNDPPSIADGVLRFITVEGQRVSTSVRVAIEAWEAGAAEQRKEDMEFARWCLFQKHVNTCEIYDTGNCSCGVPDAIEEAFEYWQENVSVGNENVS